MHPNIDVKDSIGVVDNIVSKEMCQDAITFFSDKKKFKQVMSRLDAEGSSNNQKNDLAIDLNEMNVGEWELPIKPIFINLNQAWLFYRKSTGIDDFYRNGFVYDGGKIQLTQPGGGYHLWHIEHSDSFDASTRVMFYIIYLNDGFEGGETEFLNLKRRVKPKKGRIILSPAHFPYVHRGNPPLDKDKYIMTGWIKCRV